MMVAEQVRPTIWRTNHTLARTTGADFSLAVAAFGLQCAGKSWLPIFYMFVELESMDAAMHAVEMIA
jgi:hypothetical protein